VIDATDTLPPGLRPVEVVERKGIGHPDTICDALAEQISLRLCRYYLERFGRILHHNVDKILLCGGSARPAFGGGEIVEPLELYLSGRATRDYAGERILVDDLAVDACRSWIKNHLPALDVERHVRITPRLRSGSGSLTNLFARGRSAKPLSNDTSCGAGFAPLTALESAVLAIEKGLNSTEMKRAHPASGQDIKVMGIRHNDRVHLTIACAMIGSCLDGITNYLEATEVVRQFALDTLRRSSDLATDAVVNSADDPSTGNLYLTVSGTSAEAGDDGEAGRGNRISGLITPYRPMTIEAAAGKNPVSHVGKLYNLMAGAIAARITGDVPAVHEATCVMVSQIGRSIEDPQMIDVGVFLEHGQTLSAVRNAISDLVEEELSRFSELQRDLLEERVRLY
jgi:S-adenosylmethionine synthetase